MKTQLFSLLFVLLTLAVSAASAEIDLAPYFVSDQADTEVCVIRPGVILEFYQFSDLKLAPEAWITLWNNGQKEAFYPLSVLADIDESRLAQLRAASDQDAYIFELLDHRVSNAPFAVSENLYGYISEAPEQVVHVLSGGSSVSEFALHAERETPLENYAALEDVFVYLRGLNTLECYAWDGRLLGSFALEADVLHMLSCVQTQDGALSLLVTDDDGVRLYQFDLLQNASQQQLLLAALDSYAYRGWLGGDGRSALIESHTHKTYQAKSLTRRDAQGNVLWSKTLQAEKLVVSVDAAIPHDDGSTTLYGTAMANSRGIYTAFILEVDAQGKIISRDIRDFTTTATYLYNMVLDTQRHPYVVSRFAGASSPEAGGGNKSAVVPFEDLPAHNDPGLVLE